MEYSRVCKVGLILTALVSFACSDQDVKTRSYPVIDTHAVSAINDKGANFNAEILNTGSAGISDHGFVYDDLADPTLESSDRISLGETSQEGGFSTLANRNLVKDARYFVKAYAIAKDNNFIVYGQEVEFVSLGGTAPEIDHFVPKQGFRQDTVIIVGSGFSNIRSNNKVLFDTEVAFTIKATPDSLWAIVPVNSTRGENEISVIVGGLSAKAEEKFLRN